MSIPTKLRLAIPTFYYYFIVIPTLTIKRKLAIYFKHCHNAFNEAIYISSTLTGHPLTSDESDTRLFIELQTSFLCELDSLYIHAFTERIACINFQELGAF